MSAKRIPKATGGTRRAGSWSGYNGSWEMDIFGNQLTLTDALNVGFPFGGGVDFNGFILKVLDGPDIESASVDPTSDFFPFELSVVDGDLLMNFQGVQDPGRDMATVIINFTTVPACIADLDGSGDVGFNDLLIVLAAWGPCPKEGECPADLDGSGDVGFDDLLVILTAWGLCE